jgi:hypothetical protein
MKEAKNCDGGSLLRSAAKITDFLFKFVFCFLISPPVRSGGEL